MTSFVKAQLCLFKIGFTVVTYVDVDTIDKTIMLFLCNLTFDLLLKFLLNTFYLSNFIYSLCKYAIVQAFRQESTSTVTLKHFCESFSKITPAQAIQTKID